MLELEEQTDLIIAAATGVHRALGPGFVENIYEHALAIELERRGIRFARQVVFRVTYSGATVGDHRVDLLVEDAIIVELKAVSRIMDVPCAIVHSQPKASGKRHGLVLNFAQKTLEIRRVVQSLGK